MTHILSLGAGVQSSALALMAARGEIGPMPAAAIFADTQAEPAAVYTWLDELERLLPFPLYRVTGGDLAAHVAAERPIGKFLRVDIPAYARMENGSTALINRSCTRDFKIRPIRRKVRELVGLTGKRSPKAPVVTQWIGISRDEATRMKDSREPWVVHRWPLIERELTRDDCLRWLDAKGYPRPQKSACVFCPYHDNATWRALREHPDEWAQAVEIDRRLRSRPPAAYRSKGVLYLHRSAVPLDEVDLRSSADKKSGPQINLFENECEGLCGV